MAVNGHGGISDLRMSRSLFPRRDVREIRGKNPSLSLDQDAVSGCISCVGVESKCQCQRDCLFNKPLHLRRLELESLNLGSECGELQHSHWLEDLVGGRAASSYLPVFWYTKSCHPVMHPGIDERHFTCQLIINDFSQLTR